MNKHIVTLYRYCMYKRLWANSWKKWLWISVDRLGVEFFHRGDSVIYVWPWKRKKADKVFISLGFTGNGQFGDAVYSNLKDLDRDWDNYFRAEQDYAEKHKNDSSDPFESVTFLDLV